MNALRTLIVEDDAMIAGLLAETLEGLGHRVCAVETCRPCGGRRIALAPGSDDCRRWTRRSERHCGGQTDPQQQFCPVCLRDGQRIERFVGGPGYGPPPKAVPRVGPGSSNSEGAFSGVGLRPRR